MEESRIRILHVDDREENRYVVRRMLERARFEVMEAANAGEGLRVAFSQPPDLVILDIRLPDMNGFELCRLLKKDPRTSKIPVLHLSAHFTKAADRAFGLEGGADGYLVAPAEPLELLATIGALLRSRRAEEALEQSLARETEYRQKLEVMYRSAKKANRAKDEFLATLSHELRTPLNVILGYSELLLSSDALDDGLRLPLETIRHNATLQAELINDLLDVSRIIMGKLRLSIEKVDLAKVVSEALKGLKFAAESKGVNIAVTLAPDLGYILGDFARLHQVVWNLLSNSVKFTPQEGVVSVTAWKTDSGATIQVSDTGMGIAPDFLPHVFDRLRQEDNSLTRRHGGLGLGLAITRHIVELHGGSIEARSDGKGKGATFTVHLPFVAVYSSEKSSAEEWEQGRPRGEVRLDGVRVLVVEDESFSRGLVSRVLENAGATVAALGSAMDVFAWRESEPSLPDVYVLDLGLPQEDGIALLHELREFDGAGGRRIPAVALTVYPDSRREEVLAAGFDLYLSKPVEARLLLEGIVTLLSKGVPVNMEI